MIFDGVTQRVAVPVGCLWVHHEIMIPEWVVRCRTCGGHPMECPLNGVSRECRCGKSNFVQLSDEYALFVWDEIKIVKNKLRFWEW